MTEGCLWYTSAGLLVCCCVLFGLFLFYWVKYRRLVEVYQRLYDHARANGLLVTLDEMMEATRKAGGIGHVYSDLVITSAYPEEDPDDAA